MEFLEWGKNLKKVFKILLNFVCFWRIYHLVYAIIKKESLVKPIIFLVLCFTGIGALVFFILDLIAIIKRNMPFCM